MIFVGAGIFVKIHSEMPFLPAANREEKFAYQYRVPPKKFMGEESPVRIIMLIFPGNHMDQGG